MQPERLHVRLRTSTRLDRYLTSTLAAVSRHRIQRHIARGDVLVDGRPVRPSHRLHGGEVVTMPSVVARGPELVAAPAAFDIVYEDADLVVVNKPAGLLVHPVGHEFRHTLLGALHHRLASRGETANELGIVHRLDRATSGLLVMAKHLEARRRLSRAIEARRVRRHYLAVVRGAPSQVRGSIEFAIRRDPRRPTRMQALPDAAVDRTPRAGQVSASGYSDPRRDVRARPARTHFRVLRRLRGATLLRLELETGRTHQIRVHLQAAGTPLVGDTFYGGVVMPEIDRPALHASRLEFEQPLTGASLRFLVAMPADLHALVAALR